MYVVNKDGDFWNTDYFKHKETLGLPQSSYIIEDCNILIKVRGERKREMLKKKTRYIGILILIVMFLLAPQDLIAIEDTGILQSSSKEPQETLNPREQNLEEETSQDSDVPQNDPKEEQKEQKQKISIEETELQNNSKVVYLTFDDGPNQYTDLIINILAKYNAKATFFMLEPQMEKNTGVLQRMKNEGHAFGLHGVTHDYRQFYQSSKSVITEMNTAQAKLYELTGVKTYLVRTPYGSKPYMKPEYMEAAQKAGYKIWDWNVDSKDWFYRDSRMVSNTIQQIMVLDKNNIQPVILFHDIKKTAEFLPQVLEYLIEKGYTFEILDTDLEPIQLK